MAQQGSPPRRSARLSGSRRPDPAEHHGRAGRPARPRQDRSQQSGPSPWHEPGGPDSEAGEGLPSWAGPNAYPGGPGRREMRSPGPGQDEPPEPAAGAPRRRGRAAATRLRRSRRRVYRWCGAAIVLAVLIAAVLAIVNRPRPAAGPGYITTLQHGEFRAVPNACKAVSPATAAQYLPGSARQVVSSPGPEESQCTLTVDAKPVFRVLEVIAQAYQPSAIPPGNGSATANAVYNFGLTRQGLADPGKKSALPRAVLALVPGLGQQAFSALQVFHGGGMRTDRVTVVARYRNVIVSVSLQGQDSGDGFGPVSVPALQAGALAGARDALAKATAEPTA